MNNGHRHGDHILMMQETPALSGIGPASDWHHLAGRRDPRPAVVQMPVLAHSSHDHWRFLFLGIEAVAGSVTVTTGLTHWLPDQPESPAWTFVVPVSEQPESRNVHRDCSLVPPSSQLSHSVAHRDDSAVGRWNLTLQVN